MPIPDAVRRLLGLAPRQRWPIDPPKAPVAVAEFDGWHGFMVEVLFPDAYRIQLSPGDHTSRILSALPRSARALLLNINVSLTTGFLDADAEWTGIPVLNARATDVRKRTLHACAASLGLPSAHASVTGPPDERLIIKTTLNYGGKPERLLRERFGERAARFTTDVSDTMQSTLDYRICRRADVPSAAWTDPSLVVERYITNPDGLFIRSYVVGSAAVVTLAYSTAEIKKLSLPFRDRRDHYYWNNAPLGPTSDIATCALAVTRRLAAGLGADFCGIDCAVDANGVIVPVDVNKTPYWGHPRQSPVLAHLRHGFNTLIGDFV